MKEDMTLVVAFPDTSPSFVDGYEAGTIGVAMEAGEAEIDRGYEQGFPVHTSNVEVLYRMAEAYRYTVERRETDYGEWTAMRFKLVSATRPKLVVISGGRP